MTFGGRRSGGFGTTLDPFGASRGGFSRYNITGETISSLAAAEAYAVAVAWQNGTVSDAEYLASLQKQLDLETPGTSGFIGAENKLEDAKYSIGRNKLVQSVNLASSAGSRISALEALRSYDQSRLGQMNSSNEQYREQVARIASTGADIRQTRYSELVTKVNNGQGTTAQLLALARSNQSASNGQPDADDWTNAVSELENRLKDEELTDAVQAYQHDRITGEELMAKIDSRIGDVTAGSPEAEQLKRQKEDLAEQIKNKADTKLETEMSGKRQAGTINDSQWLDYLRARYEAATPNSAEQIAAGDRLREFTFSLAEDKLRYQVQRGTAPVSRLIKFYKGYRATMVPGSERYRALTLAIDSLKGRTVSTGGGGGGGGGGASVGGGGGGTASTGKKPTGKLTDPDVTLQDLAAGLTKPKPDFAKLLSVDPTDSAEVKWFYNNLTEMRAAAANPNAVIWLYRDKSGKEYSVPFTRTALMQMEKLNVEHMYQQVALANTAYKRQTAVSKLITAKNAYDRSLGRATMDVYDKAMKALVSAKERALAGGRWAEYYNLTRQQALLIRDTLGIDPKATTNLSNATNGALNDSQLGRIAADLASLAPRLNDGSEDDNLNGDPVLGLMTENTADRGIPLVLDDDGNAIAGKLDPNRGYVTQLDDGRITIALVDQTDPNAFVQDPVTGVMVPAYTQNSVKVTVRRDGEDLLVTQPITPAGEGKQAGVWQLDSAGSDPGRPSSAAVGSKAGYVPVPVGGATKPSGSYAQTGTVAMMSTFTKENGYAQAVQWVSINGTTWYRVAPGTAAPRVVLDSTVKWDAAKGAWMKDGQQLSPAEVLKFAHIWGTQIAGGPMAFNETAGTGGIGAPGTTYVSRENRVQRDAQGNAIGGSNSFDARPEYVVEKEELTNLSPEVRRARQAAQKATYGAEEADLEDIAKYLSPEARRAATAARAADEQMTRAENVKSNAFNYLNGPEVVPAAYRAAQKTIASSPLGFLGLGVLMPEPSVAVQPKPFVPAPIVTAPTPVPVTALAPLPTPAPIQQTGQSTGDIAYKPIPKPKAPPVKTKPRPQPKTNPNIPKEDLTPVKPKPKAAPKKAPVAPGTHMTPV